MFLRELRDRFVGRVLKGWKRPSEAKKPSYPGNCLFTGHLRDVLSPGKGDPASDYEPSWVFETRDSGFWAWRRAKEVFRDWSDETHGYQEALALMRS